MFQASFQALRALTHLLLITILGGGTIIIATLNMREMRQRLLKWNVQSHHMLVSDEAEIQIEAEWLKSPWCCVTLGSKTVGHWEKKKDVRWPISINNASVSLFDFFLLYYPVISTVKGCHECWMWNEMGVMSQEIVKLEIRQVSLEKSSESS